MDKTPEATAVVFENQHLTYRELNTRANQLAHYLLKLDVGPDTLVAICMERSIEMVVAILGILKAGGGYVPLDPGNPKERLRSILADADSPVVITLEHLADRPPEGAARLLCLDREWPMIAQEHQENPASRSQRTATLRLRNLHVRFNREPKGVLISHKALVNHCFGCGTSSSLSRATVFCSGLLILLMPSVWEFFLPIDSVERH